MSITTRAQALQLLSTYLDQHPSVLPDYHHFTLPGYPELGIALWKADKKNTIVCDLTLHEEERDLWWRAGDHAHLMPEQFQKLSGFRNDYTQNKEGFNEYITKVITTVMETA